MRVPSSVFATAVGLNPYCSARSLWQYHTGRVDNSEPHDGGAATQGPVQWAGNEHTKRGAARESAALAAYTRLTGNTDVTPCGLFLHRQHSWLAASPDGLLGDDGVLELKCPARAPHAACPPLYMPQVQGQLELCDREYAHFFSVCERDGGGECVAATLFRVRRSAAYWEWLLPRLRAFYAAVQADLDPGDELRLAPGEAPPHVETACLGRWTGAQLRAAMQDAAA